MTETKPTWAQDAIEVTQSQNPTIDVSKALARGIAIAEAIGIIPFGAPALNHIVNAAEAAVMAAKQDLKDGEYGFHHAASWYEDFAGPQSSSKTFQHIVWKLGLLDEPTHGSLVERRTTEDRYDARLGAFTRHGRVTVTIDALKKLLADRERELDVDDRLIEQWNDTPSESPEARNAWLSQDFEQRMKTFRNVEAAQRGN